MNVQLLRRSFDLIAPTKEAFAHTFYARLFEQYPAVQPLFSEDISVQARSLAATLQMIVYAIENICLDTHLTQREGIHPLENESSRRNML